MIRHLVLVSRFSCLLGATILLFVARRAWGQEKSGNLVKTVDAAASITRPDIPESISPAKNLSILDADGNRVIGVLRQPPGPGPFPVVIFLHGGRDMIDLSELREYALANVTLSRFLAAGYALVVPTFRGRKRDIQNQDAFRDCLFMINHVKKKMPGIDPKSVVLYGVSGGGDLALQLAGAAELAAIIVDEPATVIFTGVIHAGFDDAPQVIANPHKFYTAELQKKTQEKIRRISCPILFVHGDQQPLNKFNNEIFVPELKAANRNMKEILYPGQIHGFSFAGPTQAAALKFFRDADVFLRPYLATSPKPLVEGQFHLVPAPEKTASRP